MTDLEDLWDDLPTSKAPVENILREGRAAELAEARDGSRPFDGLRAGRARPTRVGFVLGAAAAVGGAFVLGTLAGGNGSLTGSGDGDVTGPKLVAFSGELRAAESCDELLAYYQERGQQLVTPWGWEAQYGVPLGARDLVFAERFADESTVADFDGVSLDATSDVSNATKQYAPLLPSSQRAQSNEFGTNVQEVGVDEPDSVKTDGDFVYRTRGNTLFIHDVTGDEVTEVGRVTMESLRNAEILLVDDAVIAIGAGGADRDSLRNGNEGQVFTEVARVDVSDRTAPEVTDEVSVEAGLIAARLHGSVVRLITSAGLPALEFLGPGTGPDSEETALDYNRALIAETTIEDWLPNAVTADGSQQIADCESVALPESAMGLDTITVMGFDAADPTAWEDTTVAADASIAYASTDHLYLATRSIDEFGWCFRCSGGDALPKDEQGRTSLMEFDLGGLGTRFTASERIDGAVRDRWALDESDGILRVAVSPTNQTADENSVVTYQRAGRGLKELGRVDGLGVNEDIQSVRWFDDLAVVVTFRQIDPFYTVDLSTPSAPKLLGELKIPGFSSYLHPLGSNQIIGMGQDGRNKAQAGLFSVTDLTNPRRKQVITYDRFTQARAGSDPRQFTWLPDERVALTVIENQRGRKGFISVLTLADGQMTNRMVEAETGPDVAELRTVPVRDGKVALVTGDGVEFFDLDG